jgi:DNA-binding GntR family transcriptional regulator
MKLKVIESETLQESVYNALVDAILSGRIAPGERITLESIAKQLNVSIMPVREAVRRLQARDFVSVERNRRITVRALSPESLREILEIRLLLESVAAERAAAQRDEETVRRLEEYSREFKDATDEDAFLQANRRFHFTLYQAANMPILLEVINSLWEQVSPYLHILMRTTMDMTRAEFIRIHNGMLKGMRRKDSKEVLKWLRKDLTNAAKRVVQVLEKERSSL